MLLIGRSAFDGTTYSVMMYYFVIKFSFFICMYVGASALNKVSFSTSVISLGDYVFRGCALINLVLPSSVNYIGEVTKSSSSSLSLSIDEVICIC